jgi:tagatose 1,6-diphosphate aldolase GatY/KbaY
MLISTSQLLKQAQKGKYAIGAFNIYNLEGVKAVIDSAEELRSPVILQLLPKALELGGSPLVALCLEAGKAASVPVSVHLDHCASEQMIRTALDAGISSVMADGSHLPYDENIAYTKKMADWARAEGKTVEAELGRLSGTEDGLTVAEYEAKLTDPHQAADFVSATGVDALAVCIGNVHGKYPSAPKLDFERLAAVRESVAVPLVLHGTSGLPDEMVLKSIELGVCKFNVNTEVRMEYLRAAKDYFSKASKPELVNLMDVVVQAMKAPVKNRIEFFGSAGNA